MRIGVISDTHIPGAAEEIPSEITEAFKHVDMVLHCGDLISPQVLDMLKESCPNVKAVWGNMDPYELREKLREKEIIEADGKRIGLMHGFGHPKGLPDVLAAAFKDDKVDLIAFGHSHNPVNQKIGGIIFFNPGSATDKVFAEYNSYGIIEIGEGNITAAIVRI